MSTAPELPGYTYLDHLGSGGFADVFLYEQQWPRQQVAVKVVRPDVPLTGPELDSFRREADAMAGLADHPSIVSVITAGVVDERPYLVMRYCPPPDLGARVREEPLSVAEALATGVKLASAVETAHRSGILHRDIKPGNVLVTTYGEPALADFGIAGPVQDHDPGEVRVSYPWSPPELLDGTSSGSVSSDVYSLGATLWTLLMGRSPYAVPGGDNSPRALTARILHSNPPATGRSDVPGALDRLLQQCLAKDPGHRPQSALGLARSLQAVEAGAGHPPTRITVEAGTEGTGPATTDGEPEGATRVRPSTVPAQQGEPPSPGTPGAGGTGADPTPGAPAAPEPRRSARTGAAWVALAVVVLAVGGFWLFGGGDEAPEQQPTDASASATGTPLDVAPEAPLAPQPPVVTAERRGDRVIFRWRPEDRSRTADSWEWQDPRSGRSSRTSESRRVLRGTGRLCLQVRLIRDSQASPWTRECSS